MATSQDSTHRRRFLKAAAGSAASLILPETQTAAQNAKTSAETGAAAVQDNPFTRGMAEFVAGLRYEKIPPEVIERIKLLILDSLSCALYGTDLEWSRILIRSLTKLDRTPACSIWGTSYKLSAPHAALLNGTLVQGFELDDVHREGAVHLGSVVLPPLLAIVETKLF